MSEIKIKAKDECLEKREMKENGQEKCELKVVSQEKS